MDGSKRMPSGRVSPVAVLAIVMAVIVNLASQYRCSPTASKPNLDEIEVKNVADNWYQAVANMAGYVKLLGGTTTNFPLDVEHIYNSKLATNHSKHTIVMYGDHVSLSIEYHTKEGADSYEFTNIEMSVNDGSQPEGGYKEICRFDEPFVFSLPVESRYSCQKVLSHSCSKDGEPRANLVLKSFEIELQGDQRTASREFSKVAWEESCDHWKGSEQSILSEDAIGVAKV